MEFAFDLIDGVRRRPARQGHGDAAPPDWHALKARLLAARDASRVLVQVSRRHARGSFAREVADRLHTYAAINCGVNLTDSGNRKRLTGRTGLVGGTTGTGGRG
ncbi:hypothetical protein [Novosphingobium sp. PC22D]|uniref:hypothetical protein n=1 Tax=Novosphingobium sp. PC22D TaxID=1962403 RepID=UPI00114552A1|nr:hypothetical protein [Novosphingobium sp. PC22D]